MPSFAGLGALQPHLLEHLGLGFGVLEVLGAHAETIVMEIPQPERSTETLSLERSRHSEVSALLSGPAWMGT